MADAQDSDLSNNVNLDEAILKQVDEIQNEIANTQELVGVMEPIDVLKNEYAEDDKIFQTKIENLKCHYSHLCKTRGDGNCFFRAFGFSYFESLLHDEQEFKRFHEIAQKSKDDLVELGFPSFTIEDFHETFMNVLDSVGKGSSVEELRKAFQDDGVSNYLVVYLRLLASAQLQKKSEFFQNFLEGNLTVKEFCSQEVEPMGKESDHIHIIALTDATGVNVRVEYMDHTAAETVNHHDFPDKSEPRIFLLYRPGHYDILYKSTDK